MGNAVSVKESLPAESVLLYCGGSPLEDQMAVAPERTHRRRHRGTPWRKGSRFSGSCRKGPRTDPQGRGRGEEEKEDRQSQEEDPVQQEIRERCRDLRPQEGTQCQFLKMFPIIAK